MVRLGSVGDGAYSPSLLGEVIIVMAQKWINSSGRQLFTLENRQQFYDVPNPFPDDLTARVVEAQTVMVELNNYLRDVYNACRGSQDWKKVEVPAWLVAEEVHVELPVKPDTVPGSRSLLQRLRVQRDTN